MPEKREISGGGRCEGLASLLPPPFLLSVFLGLGEGPVWDGRAPPSRL